jgi:hypothetical protein
MVQESPTGSFALRMKQALLSFLLPTFVVLVFLPLGAPFLAQRIKDRFQALGVPMKASPGFAWLRVSGFWREAKTLQETARDPIVRRMIHVYHGWWIAVCVVLAFVVLVAAS